MAMLGSSLLSLSFHDKHYEWDSASRLESVPKFQFSSMEIYQTQTTGIREISSMF